MKLHVCSSAYTFVTICPIHPCVQNNVLHRYHCADKRDTLISFKQVHLDREHPWLLQDVTCTSETMCALMEEIGARLLGMFEKLSTFLTK